MLSSGFSSLSSAPFFGVSGCLHGIILKTCLLICRGNKSKGYRFESIQIENGVSFRRLLKNRILACPQIDSVTFCTCGATAPETVDAEAVMAYS